MATYHKYEVKKFPFQKLLQELYSLQDLTLLHQKYPPDSEIKAIGQDTHTIPHQMFFDKLRSGWEEMKDLYLALIKEVVFPIIQEDKILYQTFPSYRIQLPNNQAVKAWHYDSDEAHKHPDGEINFIMPMTPMFETNAVWVESQPRLEDFSPMEGNFGDLIQFNGNKLTHGNKINLTGQTRISFDFRILPYSKYDPDQAKASATSGLRFADGGYYRTYGK